MPKRRLVLTSKQWTPSESSRELHDHYHALGVLHARWNIAELQLQQICWFLMGAGPDVGRAVTNEMGNIARTNLLLTLAREVMKDSRLVTFFEGISKLFNRNREDRNFITHCRILTVENAPGDKMAVFQPFHADGKFRHKMYLMPVEELRQVADDVQIMNVFFGRFFDFLREGGSIEKLPSLDMPSLPHSLAQRLHSFLPSDQPQPQSSPA